MRHVIATIKPINFEAHHSRYHVTCWLRQAFDLYSIIHYTAATDE